MTNYHIVFRLCVVDLQLSVKSLPITSKAVSSNPAHGEVYSIQLLCDKVCQLLVTCRWFSPVSTFRSTWVHPRFLVGFVLLDLWFYVYVLQIVVCPFVLFLLAIVLSVRLRLTDYDYPFGIFKLFLHVI